MNILDENIDAVQRRLLSGWKVHYRHIGTSIGREGMKDINEVIPLLHSLRQPSFFTRDHGFYSLTLLHSQYCLVYLNVDAEEAAGYIRRFLRHPSFHTKAQRMGKLVRVLYTGITWWEGTAQAERALSW